MLSSTVIHVHDDATVLGIGRHRVRDDDAFPDRATTVPSGSERGTDTVAYTVCTCRWTRRREREEEEETEGEGGGVGRTAGVGGERRLTAIVFTPPGRVVERYFLLWLNPSDMVFFFVG